MLISGLKIKLNILMPITYRNTFTVLRMVHFKTFKEIYFINFKKTLHIFKITFGQFSLPFF